MFFHEAISSHMCKKVVSLITNNWNESIIRNIHWLCGNENVLQTLRKEIFTGYAGTKVFTIFDSKLVMRRFPVVMYLSMWSY